MLARVHRFLIDEIVDLFAQRRGRPVPIMAHRGHEEFLADREGRRQRVEKGGTAGIAAMPPAPRRGAAPEFPVPLMDRQIGGSRGRERSEEHTSELQSLMRISYAVFCLNKKKHTHTYTVSDK